MEVEDDGTAWFRRHVPDDDLLAIHRGQDLLLDIMETGGGRCDALARGNGKQDRALHQQHGGEPADVTDGDDDQQPFQDGHGGAANACAGA